MRKQLLQSVVMDTIKLPWQPEKKVFLTSNNTLSEFRQLAEIL